MYFAMQSRNEVVWFISRRRYLLDRCGFLDLDRGDVCLKPRCHGEVFPSQGHRKFMPSAATKSSKLSTPFHKVDHPLPAWPLGMKCGDVLLQPKYRGEVFPSQGHCKFMPSAATKSSKLSTTSHRLDHPLPARPLNMK